MEMRQMTNEQLCQLEVGQIAYAPSTGSHYWLVEGDSPSGKIWEDILGRPVDGLPLDTQIYPERVL
jgi:hypothetical protein